MKRKIWRIVGALVLVVSPVLGITTTTSATGGPHEGTFTTLTDSCAICHRAHTGEAAKILAATSQYDLCISCHDGTSANTKVTTGVYLGTTNGTQNAGLRGGGFVRALMNTTASGSFNTTGTPTDITSKHTVGASSATAWGSGNSTSGDTVALECGNCHNPHGNSWYRLLRPKPTSLAAFDNLTSVNITDEGTKTYTITYDGSNYRDLSAYSSNTTSKMADWCGQCHTRYIAGNGSGSTDPGSSPFLYRHVTDNMSGECLACHVAHGTSASMSGRAAGVPWPAGASPDWQDTDEGNDSRLLYIDNRGVCIQCHSSSALSQN